MYKIKFHKLGSSFRHHGTKGQVHGVRNYQNPDGSLTELGREHYGVGPPRDNEHSEYGDIRENNRQKVKSGKDAFKALPLKKRMEVRVKGSKLGIRYTIDHVKNCIKNGSKEKFDNSNDLQAHFFDRAMKDTNGDKALSYLASHVTKDYLKNDNWADIIREEGARQFMQRQMNHLEDTMRWGQDTQLNMMFRM